MLERRPQGVFAEEWCAPLFTWEVNHAAAITGAPHASFRAKLCTRVTRATDIHHGMNSCYLMETSRCNSSLNESAAGVKLLHQHLLCHELYFFFWLFRCGHRNRNTLPNANGVTDKLFATLEINLGNLEMFCTQICWETQTVLYVLMLARPHVLVCFSLLNRWNQFRNHVWEGDVRIRQHCSSEIVFKERDTQITMNKKVQKVIFKFQTKIVWWQLSEARLWQSGALS